MTAQLSAYGRLGQNPRQIETRTGKAMAIATLAVDVADGEDEPPLWLGVVAFGPLADTLLRHSKGDLLSACGRFHRRTYTTREGEEREQWQIIADAIVSARTVRPGGGRKKKEEATKPKSDMPDEPLPF